jgi:HD-GYP domain-containing protein (c-di-GMP phosphodiesterase class II)
LTLLVKEFDAAQERLQRSLENLSSSHRSLEKTYDATLEGWSHALYLRDRATDDHSQRVLETTLRLARATGISETEIPHIRQGVLLHDIGKLGVPDEILRKPGPLTEAEWVEMRRHPNYAYELLYPIPYLHAALNIPYCHHEKWDGTGYPRQLKGGEIPLEARVFAIVDVWDALSSDRPYRSKLPEPEVLAYLRDQAGKHFDPHLLEVFMEIVNV